LFSFDLSLPRAIAIVSGIFFFFEDKYGLFLLIETVVVNSDVGTGFKV